MISSLCLPSDKGCDRFEGAVERKCLLKNYKTPRISKWKHYWVTICDHLLLFHEEKSLLFPTRTGLSRRSSYRDSPAKCQSITDWLVVLSERQPRNEIQLSDLNRGQSPFFFSSENKLDLCSRLDVQTEIRRCHASQSLASTSERRLELPAESSPVGQFNRLR